MNNDARSRIVAPILIPVAILLAMVGFIGLIATLLLYNTHEGALALATVAAAGVLLSVSLLASQDKLDPGRRFVAVGAGVLPLLLGGAISLGIIGDIDDADLNRNVQPLLVIPDDAPLIGAQNLDDFCFFDEGGNCVDGQEWDVVPSVNEENLSFLFDNLDTDGHNVVIAELEGSADAPEQGADILESPVIASAQDYYVDPELAWDDLPEQWYFYCEIHPAMNGVGQVVADG
ncbi:hypothetical protein FTX61_05495 [Nitriliruptoraceae bacterium ZYF776]|nr:hypothetical protein [Profundirhabdus halotolerans]